MRSLVLDDFAGRVGEGFDVEAGETAFPLVLESVKALGGSARPGGAFNLLFRGPADPVLSQGIYRFRLEGEAADIFIVPVARDESGTLYEAVFN